MGISHSLFRELNKSEQQLLRLTKELSPKDLLKEMIELSL